MTLIKQLSDYFCASCAGIWIQSSEIHEVDREILEYAKSQQEKRAGNRYRVFLWNVTDGLRHTDGSKELEPFTSEDTQDPLSPLRLVPDAMTNWTNVLILHNYHRFLGGAEVVQAMAQQVLKGKQTRALIVVVSPVVAIPPELEKLFIVVEHQLPDREALKAIAQETTQGDFQHAMPEGEALDHVLDASAGLTRYEAEGAYSLSIVRHDAILPAEVWKLKSQALKKNNLLTLYEGDEKFNSIGGMSNLKGFCQLALRPGNKTKARGLLLLGPPGGGKSMFCKALGNEMQRPTLMLDIGAMMGSLVGQSEANIRQALRIADAMQPCVLFVDEIEKALSGFGSSGDNGVSTRMFGTILTWLSDHTSDVFFIASANDISKLPPEFSRAERFDGVFFLDLPSADDKAAIWALYQRQFELEKQTLPEDLNWTGAEIRACCRMAALLGTPLVDAAKNVVPVAITAAEQMEKLRTWASQRCLDANRPGVYDRGKTESHKTSARRKINPQLN